MSWFRKAIIEESKLQPSKFEFDVFQIIEITNYATWTSVLEKRTSHRQIKTSGRTVLTEAGILYECIDNYNNVMWVNKTSLVFPK